MTKQQAAENLTQYKDGKIQNLDRDTIDLAILVLSLQSKYEVPKDIKDAYSAGYKAGVEAYMTFCSEDEDRIQLALEKFESWMNCKEYSWGEKNILRSVINVLRGIDKVEEL